MCMYISTYIFDVYTCMYICTYIVAIHMLGKRFVCVCVCLDLVRETRNEI